MDGRVSSNEGPRLVERQVGGNWLITSPDLPGLYVAHADLDTARKAAPSAIRMLTEMAGRQGDRIATGA